MEFTLIREFPPNIVMQCLKAVPKLHILKTRTNSELSREFSRPAFSQFLELFFTSEWDGLWDRLAYSQLFSLSLFHQPLLLLRDYRFLPQQRTLKLAQGALTSSSLDALVLKLEPLLDSLSILLKL